MIPCGRRRCTKLATTLTDKHLSSHNKLTIARSALRTMQGRQEETTTTVFTEQIRTAVEIERECATNCCQACPGRQPPPDADWPTIREALVAHARSWEADDPEFAAARVRLFHQEPALGSRYLEYCEEYEDWLTDVVAARRATDRCDIRARLAAASIVAGLRSAFKAQAGTSGTAAGSVVVAHLESAFDALEAGPLADLG